MIKSENGTVLLQIMFMCSLILTGLLSTLSLFHDGSQMATSDLRKLQAKYNAEAGVWMAIETWKNDRGLSDQELFSLSHGYAQVTWTSLNGTILQIQSEGIQPPDYKEKVMVLYDSNLNSIVDWKVIR